MTIVMIVSKNDGVHYVNSIPPPSPGELEQCFQFSFFCLAKMSQCDDFCFSILNFFSFSCYRSLCSPTKLSCRKMYRDVA